jgi:hypothetical protein
VNREPRVRYNTLKLQPEKCEFLRKEVSYLGHVITEDGVKPDPNKVRTIENFPTPTTVKQLKAFFRNGRLLQEVYSKF